MIIPDDIAERTIILKDKYFDLRGLSAYSSTKVSTLREYVREGMPAFKIKGKILIRMSEFDRWIEQYRLNKAQNIDTMVDDIMGQLTT